MWNISVWCLKKKCLLIKYLLQEVNRIFWFPNESKNVTLHYLSKYVSGVSYFFDDYSELDMATKADWASFLWKNDLMHKDSFTEAEKKFLKSLSFLTIFLGTRRNKERIQEIDHICWSKVWMEHNKANC